MAKRKAKVESARPAEPLGLEAFAKPPEHAGISLDELGAAFAEMLSTGEDPYAEGSQGEEDLQNLPPHPLLNGHSSTLEAPDLGESDACEISPRSILEAILFVGSPGNEPITSQQVAALMRGVRPAEIDLLVVELNEKYLRQGCPYSIVCEGAGYRLTLREEFHRVRDRFYGRVRQARISQAAIDVLSLVAYHEPLTSEEINKLRGTTSGAILSQMVRRSLLRLDRSDKEFPRGRYYTTPRFLQLFGLESLDELPQSDDSPPA
jgi:segregation and condensation protein B